MRHIILVFILIILPLRGWVGEVMATEMAAGGMGPHQAVLQAELDRSAPEVNVDVRSMPDCVDHGTDANNTSDEAHCSTCAVCQVCHTVGMLPGASVDTAVLFSPAQLHSSLAVFASALVALSQKPPIS